MDEVFRITNGEELIGNGFIIRDNYAVTNSHVIRAEGSYAIINDQSTVFRVVKDFKGSFEKKGTLDLAIIQSPLFESNNVYEIREDNLLGEVLHIKGFNQNFVETNIQTYSGICKNFKHKNLEYSNSVVFYNSDAQPIKGNSGSVVYDNHNSIVGIFYLVETISETSISYAYFIKIPYLIKEVTKYIE